MSGTVNTQKSSSSSSSISSEDISQHQDEDEDEDKSFRHQHRNEASSHRSTKAAQVRPGDQPAGSPVNG
ncbi:hypothetical protein AWZ03_003192 [Drosophila navojoa]|uniref:Uncharacterized protein n=1 Tax=Drosophila navojoa TaxID=7232 RepID=A0A484BND8_DRONA|nr:hypothetical protein AWZ03_003192 [Drosophila navojoa]